MGLRKGETGSNDSNMYWYCDECGYGPSTRVRNICPDCGAIDGKREGSLAPASKLRIPSLRFTDRFVDSDIKTKIIKRNRPPKLHRKFLDWKLIDSPQFVQREPDHDESMSMASASQESVFSRLSLQTWPTIDSEHAGFSVAQIHNATRVFVSVLYQDEFLVPLYETARKSTRIGTKRLRRKLRERIKVLADNLQDEAKDHIEFAASRLVRVKSRYAAQCLATNYSLDWKDTPGRTDRHERSNVAEETSDEEMEEQQLNEREYVDLNAFHLFLTESAALVTLRADMQVFCATEAKSVFDKRGLEATDLTPASKGAARYTWLTWRNDLRELNTMVLYGMEAVIIAKAALFLVADAVFLATDDTLVAIGCLEPLLERGRTRIRIGCSCGDNFFDDLIEQSSGDIAAMVQELRQSLPDVNITIIPYRAGSAFQQYSARVSPWLRQIISSLLIAFQWHHPSHRGLPQHNAPGIALTPGVIAPSTPQQQQQQPQQSTLHLMTCVHRTRGDASLLQNDIWAISNDRALFNFLRSKISQRRNRVLLVMSCRSIVGIFFSKFRLGNAGTVEIRHHDPCCRSVSLQSSICECFPPIENIEPFPNAEYRCSLPCPPDTWPLVGPKMLLHMLKCPNKISEKSRWIYNLVPKRIAGELSAGIDQPTEGWGFYFQEGWDFDLIITISFVVFILGSLLFGICWSVLEHDIQGAFGVSAYMVTACGLFVAFVVSKTG